MIIIMRFGEYNVLGPKYINIYINFRGARGRGLHGQPYSFCFVLIKTEKVQEHDLY